MANLVYIAIGGGWELGKVCLSQVEELREELLQVQLQLQTELHRRTGGGVEYNISQGEDGRERGEMRNREEKGEGMKREEVRERR